MCALLEQLAANDPNELSGRLILDVKQTHRDWASDFIKKGLWVNLTIEKAIADLLATLTSDQRQPGTIPQQARQLAQAATPKQWVGHSAGIKEGVVTRRFH